MDAPDTTQALGPLAGRHSVLQWCALLGASVVLIGAMEYLALPAALLIGAMLTAIGFGSLGATVRVSERAFAVSQSFVGMLVAGAIEPSFIVSFLEDWPIFIAAVTATVAASSLLGWLISRWRVLPGTTGVWGSAPGAATAMVLMADAFGADARLVAFMQYLRVIFVTLAAAAIARLWVDTSGVDAPAVVWFPAIEAGPFATTLAVALGGAALGTLLRLPSPFFLGAFLIGIPAHLAGIEFQLPQWLLAVSYLLIGWTIGLKFDRAILAVAVKALPQIVLSILALMAFCGGTAWVLANEFGVDPLTAYLATSPGGMDSVAIIAAASHNVNISFIMALQMVRFVFVLAFGPPISRLVARMVRE